MLNKQDYLFLKQLEQTDVQTSLRMKALMKNYSANISMLTHEIRNSLTLADSSIQLITSNHPKTKDYRLWNQVLHEMTFLRNLLEDFSQFQHAQTLHKTTINLNTYVQSVIASFTDILEKQQIRLTYTCSLTNTDIFIDPAKLRQVLINLIKNAIEAVEKNGDILIHVYCVDNNAVISIEDNGCGIQSPENIFDPFYTTKPQGTGLGLPFCQEIALIHEGSLSFDISERGYTRFLLTLPLLCT